MTSVALASDTGKEYHHLILGMLGGNGGQVKRERDIGTRYAQEVF